MKKKNSKTTQFWKLGVNAITGWKPARVKMTKTCIESKPLKIENPTVFKPKGFR